MLLLGGIAVTSARAADEPAAGTWKVNLAKSKYNPGPAPQSSTATIKIENDTETFDSEIVDASGATAHSSFTTKLDAPRLRSPAIRTATPSRSSAVRLLTTWSR